MELFRWSVHYRDMRPSCLLCPLAAAHLIFSDLGGHADIGAIGVGGVEIQNRYSLNGHMRMSETKSTRIANPPFSRRGSAD